MTLLKSIFLKCVFFILFLTGLQAHAQFEATEPKANLPEVEWYPPEIEKGQSPDRAKVIISGRTQPGAAVRIDKNSISNLAETEAEKTERQLRVNCKLYERPDIKSKVLDSLQKNEKVQTTEYSETWLKVFFARNSGFVSQPCFFQLKNQPNISPSKNAETRSNAEGFFEISLELPQGLIQVPVLVVSPTKAQKTFLLSVDVSPKKKEIKINTQVSRRKPPAAAKRIRIWGGLGMTYQSNNQSTSGSPNLAFKTFQAPGLLGRAGYWGERWGIDFYFRDAPGKIETDSPFRIQSDTYHWRTMEAKGLYQMNRGPTSRFLGLSTQWQIRFGAELHQIPFMDIDTSNLVTIRDHSLLMATLGAGLLLGQEADWSYEFALGLQTPLSAAGQGNPFSVSSLQAYEAQIGAAYKIAPNWRLGLFSYTQSLSYSYVFQNNIGTSKTGKQNLFYTSFDLRLGYEY